MKTIIGIIGGRRENCPETVLPFAYAVGYELGRRGYAIVCGGGDGVMEAASKGCQEAGGIAIGILKWNHSMDVNPHIDYCIPTSMDLARNNVIIWAARGLIAFDGGYGTAGEICLALDAGRPLVVAGASLLLKETAYDLPHCRHLPGGAVTGAQAVVDQLVELMRIVDPNQYARHE